MFFFVAKRLSKKKFVALSILFLKNDVSLKEDYVNGTTNNMHVTIT